MHGMAGHGDEWELGTSAMNFLPLLPYPMKD